MTENISPLVEELVITKIALRVISRQLVPLPLKFRILELACERGDPFMWVMHTKDQLFSDRLVEMVFPNELAPVRKDHVLIYLGSLVLTHSEQRIFVFIHDYISPVATAASWTVQL